MRDIKFRFYNKKKQVMVNWENLKAVTLIALEDNEDGESYSPWMQYTGLNDRNGKEIYEGDVLKGGQLHCTGGFRIENEHGAVVSFENGMFKLGSVSLISFNKRAEVIGNIYEDSNLLEVSE